MTIQKNQTTWWLHGDTFLIEAFAPADSGVSLVTTINLVAY